MATMESSFPTVTLYNNGGAPMKAMMFGMSPNRRRALITLRVPMEEKHLEGGSGGGRSKIGLVDDKGNPKVVLVGRMASFCERHMTAWLDDQGCPECKKESEGVA